MPPPLTRPPLIRSSISEDDFIDTCDSQIRSGRCNKLTNTSGKTVACQRRCSDTCGVKRSRPRTHTTTTTVRIHICSIDEGAACIWTSVCGDDADVPRCAASAKAEATSSDQQKPPPVSRGLIRKKSFSSPAPPQRPPSHSSAATFGRQAGRQAGELRRGREGGWKRGGETTPSERPRAEEEKIKLHLGGKFYQGIVIVSWQLLSIWVISRRDRLNRRNLFPSEMIFSNSLIDPDPAVLRRGSKRLIRPTWPADDDSRYWGWGSLKIIRGCLLLCDFFNDGIRIVAMWKHVFIQLYVIKLNRFEAWWWSLHWLKTLPIAHWNTFHSQKVEVKACVN